MNFDLEREFLIKQIQGCNEEWVLKAIRRLLHNVEEENKTVVENLKEEEIISFEQMLESMKASH